MRGDPAVGHAGPTFRLGLDNACLAVFSIVGPSLAVAGGGRLGLPSTLDAGTVLAVLACLGPASSAKGLARLDRTILVVSALTWLAPDGRIIAAALTAAGMLGWRRASQIPACLATMWLAIALHVLWAPLVFRFVGRWIIAAEMTLIGGVARALMSNVQVEGARIQSAGGWYVYVLEGCSAFAGISASALVWLATLRLLGELPTRQAFLGLAVAMCGVVAVNVARILLMLPSADDYAFWHSGSGSTVVVAVGILLGAAPAIMTGTRR